TRGSSQALPRKSRRKLFEFGTLPSIAASLKRTSDIARTWLTPTVPSLSRRLLRQTSADGRDSVDGGGEGATAATWGSVPALCGIDGPATAARALPGGAVVALDAAAPARTRGQPSTPTKVIRPGDANSKPKKLNIFDSGTAQTTLPSPR